MTVVAFPGNVQPLVDGVNVDLIDTLEQALDDAKAGRLTAGAFVLVFADGKTRTGWVNATHTHDQTASGLLTLMWRYGKETVE